MKKEKKKEKSSLKDKILDIVPIIAILLIVFLVAIMISNEKNISKTMKIHNISYSEFQDKIKEDKFNIILIGRDNCSHCADYKPLVNQVANQYDLNVWYLNISTLQEEEYIFVHNNVNVLKDQYDPEGNLSIPTPATVIYRNGYEIDSILGDVGENGFKNLLVKNGVVK